MKEKVEEAIRVHQNNDMAVAFGVASGMILERALLEESLPDDGLVSSLSEEAKAAWSKAGEFEELEELLVTISHEAMKGKEDSPFYDLYGRSCALPGSFTAPCFLFQQMSSQGPESFEKALRSNILGAGDTCSRGIFLGAVLAAAKGGPPQSWLDKMDKETMERVDAAAEKIAEAIGAV